ncbi:MAG: UDP-N-acetylmuramoyl-L-alanyl-D-glutamate--2,6-diaminopimelate ligase [Bacillota bacterium]
MRFGPRPMKLSELVRSVEYKAFIGQDVECTGISYDSRRVAPGDLFVCVPGYNWDGHAFADDAVKAGAVALIVQRQLAVSVPQVVVPNSREAMALVSLRFYNNPSSRLELYGVTGTNGKTTTTHLIRAILEGSGRRCGLIGTIENIIGGQRLPVEHTTPEAPDLQRLFHLMSRAGDEACSMEVSSHALEMHRVTGCQFDVGVFTNLTQDHLDFHGSLDSYRRAKARLFEMLDKDDTAVLNADDPASEFFAGATTARVVTYGTRASSEFRAEDISISAGSTEYTLISPVYTGRVVVSVSGRFNVYNSLAALAACTAQGVDAKTAIEALRLQKGVPGRFETVYRGAFSVIVDYAHTPDGLLNVLKSARELTSGRLIVVFGCGGDRDRTKRPIMGKIGTTLADVAIITSDNPRSEDPEAIIEEVLAGAREGPGEYTCETDRRQAIFSAIRLAREKDVVVIAGKGHETYQIFRDRTIHFDDKEVAREALEALGI